MSSEQDASPDILDRALKGPQEIAPGITFEWIDGHVIVLKLATVARDPLDTYAEAYARLVRDSSQQQPFLAMVDTTDGIFTFTPYVRQKISEMEEAVTAETPGRLALLMEPSVKSQVFRLTMRAVNMAGRSKRLERKIFLSYDEAMSWLKAGLPKGNYSS